MSTVTLDLADSANASNAMSVALGIALASVVNVGNAATAPYHYNLCEKAYAHSEVIAGVVQPNLANSANVSDAVDAYSFIPAADTVRVSDSVVWRVTTNQLLVDRVRVSEAATFGVAPPGIADVADASNATSDLTAVYFADGVNVSNASTLKTTAIANFADAPKAHDDSDKGGRKDIADAVHAGSAYVATRVATFDVADGIRAANAQAESDVVNRDLHKDTVNASDAVTHQVTTHATLVDVVDASDGYSSPNINQNATALVCNTETSAASQWLGFDVNSMAQLGDTILLATPDGLFTYSGDTDDGTNISAYLTTGFSELGTTQHKRVSDAYLGLEVDGDLTLSAFTYGPTPSAAAYTAQLRPGVAPVATRVIMPKGLVSRYWKLNFANVAGSYFDISTVEMNVAETARKV